MGTTNIEKLLGLDSSPVFEPDLVAYHGGDIFDMSSKAVAIVSARRGIVDLFQ
jgi:hypothetical protein